MSGPGAPGEIGEHEGVMLRHTFNTRLDIHLITHLRAVEWVAVACTVCKRVDAADAIQLPSVPGGKRRGGTSEPETVLGCLLVDVQ